MFASNEHRRTWACKLLQAGCILLALAGALALYCAEFNLPSTKDAVLEEAISTYHYADAELLARAEEGNAVFVLYTKGDGPGSCGITRLQKGPLGRWRVLHDSYGLWPLYGVKAETIGAQSYALLFGSGALPDEVASWAVYINDGPRPLTGGAPESAPFIRLVPSGPDSGEWLLDFYDLRYYDSDGTLLDAWAMEHANAMSTGVASSNTNESVSIFYFLMVLIILIGVLNALFIHAMFVPWNTAASNGGRGRVIMLLSSWGAFAVLQRIVLLYTGVGFWHITAVFWYYDGWLPQLIIAWCLALLTVMLAALTAKTICVQRKTVPGGTDTHYYPD